jgi:hypothetical protein
MTMSERKNFFDFPHKAFRYMWMDVVAAIGATNPSLDGSLAAMEAKVTFACDAYAHHNKDESEWMGPRLQELDASLAKHWLADHDSHVGTMEELQSRAHAIRSTPDVAERTRALGELYRYVCRFLAEDLVHMQLEQEPIMAAFQKAYSDDQLQAMEAQFIQERINPALMKSLAPLFLKSGNVDDRTRLLSVVKRQVPPPAFEELLAGLVAGLVGPEELAQLRSRLAA